MHPSIIAVAPGKPLPPPLRRQGIDAFRRHGVLQIGGLFSTQLVAKLHAAFRQRYLSLSGNELRKRYAVVGHRRFMITVRIKPPFDAPELFANPAVMPMMRRLLGVGFTISSFGSVVARPGADAQPAHFDYPPLYESEATCAALPPHAVTLMIPLVDLTTATGSTAVWPGSHQRIGARQELERIVETRTMDGSVLPLPQAGDALLIDFRLIHAGTPNDSHIDRPVLYIVYRRPWFDEQKNFTEQPPLKISQKRLARLPRKHRRLFS